MSPEAIHCSEVKSDADLPEIAQKKNKCGYMVWVEERCLNGIDQGEHIFYDNVYVPYMKLHD